MSWKKYIIIIVFGLMFFGVGFMMGSNQTFESLLNYYISSVLPYVKGVLSVSLLLAVIGLVIEMTSIIWGLIEDKEKKKLNHSRILLDNFKSMTITEIGFSNDRRKLHIQINNVPTTSGYEMYSENVDAHLETGYPNIWGLIEKRERDINQYNIDLQGFLDNFHSILVKQLSEIFGTTEISIL
jgi:hypothetical protein